MNYIFFAGTILILPILYFILNRYVKRHRDWILKSFSLFLAVVFFIRYYSVSGSLLTNVWSLSINNPFSSSYLCFSAVILIWLQFTSVAVLWLLPFFKFKLLRNVAKYFCLVVNVLALGFMQQIIYAFTGTYNLSLCGAFMGIEIGVSLLYSVLILATDGFKMSKKEVGVMAIALPIAILFSVPRFTFGALFGRVGVGACKGFELYHRIYIYLTFLILFGFYFLFRRKEKEFVRMSLLYLSLVTLITYCYYYDFSSFIEPSSWPLHLCNTAMFIVPICLIFKLKKLFYFTFFINVLGAFFAILMPNYSDVSGAFSAEVVAFWVNHIMAFAMPVLIVFLGVYERPKLKEFFFSMLGFLLYFTLVVFLNSYFTAIGKNVDFFFVNSDFIAEKLGTWAENLRDTTWTWKIDGKALVFYPVYQSLFFAVYIALGALMWFLYTWLFQIQDFYAVLSDKRRKIKLDEMALCVKYGKKEIGECMNEKSVGKLVVKNVFKRYGDNKNYAVKDISFEANSGEILGFLGPNGAGKSTIIKCIVGIQPATKGNIEINGYDISAQPVLAKEQFGFVPDHYALYEKLTGREYINYIADLYGVTKEERDARLEKLLKDLRMQASIDREIRTYSHGMKQKVAIMSALIHNPKLWILDEPLTGLDPNSIYEVKECMKEHAKNGNIVFFSSHIIDIVEKLCDRIVIIKKGEIVTSTTLDALKEKGVGLEEFYLNIIGKEKEELPDVRQEEVKKTTFKEKFLSFFKRKKKKNSAEEKNENITEKIGDINENLAEEKPKNEKVVDNLDNVKQPVGKKSSANEENKSGEKNAVATENNTISVDEKNDKTNQEKNDGIIETKQGEQKNVSKSKNKKGKK